LLTLAVNPVFAQETAEKADFIDEIWMQPIKTTPWPEEEVAFLKNLWGMKRQRSVNKETENLCETITNDLLAMRDVEYIPPVHYSLFYDTEEMSKLLGDCFYKLDLDNPNYIFMKPPIIRFVNGFTVFIGNYDNISENGKEVIVFADGGIPREEDIEGRSQMRLKDTIIEFKNSRVLIFSPAGVCSEKYNKRYGGAYVDMIFLGQPADFNPRFFGMFRYGESEYIYDFQKLIDMYEIGINGQISVDGQAEAIRCYTRFYAK
jgi:hypothetical protein